MLHASTMMPGKVSAMAKVYEEVAALAYQRVSKEAFQWMPKWVISLMGINESKEELFADSNRGACVELCPQDAAQDQSSLYQVIRNIGNGRSVTALLAPGLSEQLSSVVRQNGLTSAFRMMGFQDVFEVSAANRMYTQQISQEIQSMSAGIKDADQDALVVLITSGAQSAPKVAGVDYVLSLEEVKGMLDARGLRDEMIRQSDEEPLKYTRAAELILAKAS